MGVPSPGETALVLAAVLASQGKLQIWLVILIGVSSAIIGDNLGYWLGRRFGREVLEARGPLRQRRLGVIAAGDDFFERHGPKAVFFARWIALVRFAAAWLAGINEMPFRQFFVWNALGGITWGITYGLVGYYAGRPRPTRSPASASTPRSRWWCWSSAAMGTSCCAGAAGGAERSGDDRAPLSAAGCLLGVELQRAGVDAVALPGGVRPVVEDVAKMTAAALAQYLGTPHPEASVFAQLDILGDRRLVEARPARARTRTWCPS